MYHVESAIQENINNVCQENIYEITNREMELADISLEAASRFNNINSKE